MTVLFDYERTVRALFGFAVTHPTLFVWLAGTVLAFACVGVVDTARLASRRWLARR